VVELDFLYPSEGIHKRWDRGYWITAAPATCDQAAFVLSVPRRRLTDETQETLRTINFPSKHVKVNKPAVVPHSVSYLQLTAGSDKMYSCFIAGQMV
jgi:nitrate reductase cytochrome c-type subunit